MPPSIDPTPEPTDPLDALEIQRWIDGELTPAETDAFLEIAQSDPSTWRSIALRAVEEIRIERAMTRRRQSAPVAAPVDRDDQPTRPRSNAAWQVAIAASALALLTGWGLGRRTGSPAASPKVAENRSVPSPSLVATIPPQRDSTIEAIPVAASNPSNRSDVAVVVTTYVIKNTDNADELVLAIDRDGRRDYFYPERQYLVSGQNEF